MGLFKRKQSRDAVDPETGLRYKDLDVVRQLVKHGADMTQSRHVLYYLYFGSAETAWEAAEAARAGGFEVVAQPLPQYPDRWSLRCERHGLVLDPETIKANRDLFEGIAAQFSGEFDGWEASVS